MENQNFNYLQSLRNINHKIDEKIYIIGNETCDLDSVLSSYILSISKNIESNLYDLNGNINNSIHKIYYPVINCKKEELNYRFEVKYILNNYNINSDLFYYITDNEFLENNLLDKKIKIILVDTSKLNKKYSYLNKYVIDIYDHHPLNEINYQNIKNINIKYPLGSCITLILLENFFNSGIPKKFISEKICVAPILIDTDNFADYYYKNKWIDLDKVVFNKISNFDLNEQNKFYEILHKEKFSIENNLNLGADILLKKDMKIFDWSWNKLYWSHLHINYYKFEERFKLDFVIKTILDIIKDDQYFYVISSQIEENIRVFILFDFEKKIKENTFESDLKNKLGEKMLSFKKKEKDNHLMLFIEVNNEVNRKNGEPILKEILNNIINSEK